MQTQCLDQVQPNKERNMNNDLGFGTGWCVNYRIIVECSGILAVVMVNLLIQLLL